MMIELSKLRPNPFRNFRVDPIDEANVQQLVESINDHDFWGGPTCRKMPDGTYQIAAGHHRIEAAVRAGIKSADIYVGKFDDEQMIRIYAVENATQRGNTSTAMGGSVASAIRFIAKDLLVFGTASQFYEAGKSGSQNPNPADLGEPPITKFLHDVQGINESTVRVALKQIKASGEYEAILADVLVEIEAENAEAEKKEQTPDEAEARKASGEKAKAAVKKAKREITFDRNGVAPHFTNQNHLRAFQECVEGPGVKPYLAVNQQSALAAALVKKAGDDGRELTGAFIRESIVEMVLGMKQKEREFSKKEQEELLRNNLLAKARKFQDDFSRSCRGMNSAGIHLASLQKDWPKNLPFPITGEFREALRQAAIVIEQLTKKV
jgi:hypothetical protein